MLHNLTLSAILSTALLLTAHRACAADCNVLYQAHLATDLTLEYQAFDQTQDQGFRVLAAAGCYREAADLIEAYVAATHAEQSSLRWHIAQLRATHGDNESAIRYARETLNDNEVKAAGALRWNDYVLATIAFLENDPDALQQHRDNVAEAADGHPGNALNLKLLNALQRHIGQSYAYATSRIK